MNVTFSILARGLLLALLVFAHPGILIAQELNGITWTREVRDNQCVKLRFEMPASLVPIYDAGTASAVGSWQSFEGDFKFLYADNATHLDLTSLPKQAYLNMGRCTETALKSSKCWMASNTRAKLYRMAGSQDWTGESKKDRLCMEIAAFAPATDDQSRFGVLFQFCGPESKKTFVQSVALKSLKSLEYSYQGCCKGGRLNINGCKNG